MHLKCGLICAEWVMRGPFVEREIFSMFVESHEGVTSDITCSFLFCVLSLSDFGIRVMVAS